VSPAEAEDRARLEAVANTARAWNLFGDVPAESPSMSAAQRIMTPRWYPLMPHPVQVAMILSLARIKVAVAGRRSGKTERMKRQGVIGATGRQPFPDMRYFLAAPTRDQAKDLFWGDLKAMIAPWMHARRPSETELSVGLWNGATIRVVGMDRPERIEGKYIDWWGGDEIGKMKATAWPYSVRPGLDTPGRPGRAWMIGKPVGRNHWWEIWNYALSEESGPDWAGFRWTSEEVQSPESIAAAKRDMGTREYAQEYLAQFLTQEGRVYYGFDREVHCAEPLHYDPDLDLILCFDFNRKPGVAAIVQEQVYAGTRLHREGQDVGRDACVAPNITAVVDEVFVKADCTTRTVCEEIIRRWGPEGRNHQNRVLCYGDSTGGAAGSQAVAGSNWQIVMDTLKTTWAGRVFPRYPAANPKVVARVNATNKRFLDAMGIVRVLVDGGACPNLVRDLEEVTWLPGTNEIDKPSRGQEGLLTHISDAIGYYIAHRYPAQGSQRAVRLPLV